MNQEEQLEQNQEIEHTQEESSPTPEEVLDQSPQDPDQSPSSPQATNMRKMREAKERAERDRDELLRRVAAIEAAQGKKDIKPQAVVEDFSIAPDDLVEGKHLSKYDRKIEELKNQLKSYQQQTSTIATEAKLHSQYPDLDKIITKENIAMLSTLHPEIANTIASSSDLYNKAVSAYTFIKKLGIVPANTYDAERTRAHENSAKPRPVASISAQQGDSPLTRANAFADGLTDDLKKRLHKEMIEAMK